MRMDHVGTEIQASERFRGGCREEGKAFPVVGIVALGRPVKEVTVQILVSLDHQEAERALSRLPDGERHFFSVPVHLEALDDPAEREVLLFRLPVERQENPELAAEWAKG